VTLQKKAFCVVSDSGTLTEESSILGFPGVMIREVHERPQGMDEGSVIMSDLDAERIVQAVRVLRSQSRHGFRIPEDYTAENVALK
jgi:UDP-N-acetylglucosamine 2-epimerase